MGVAHLVEAALVAWSALEGFADRLGRSFLPSEELYQDGHVPRLDLDHCGGGGNGFRHRGADGVRVFCLGRRGGGGGSVRVRRIMYLFTLLFLLCIC
jgi:hypothetical protein